jgi:hypothetical protein
MGACKDIRTEHDPLLPPGFAFPVYCASHGDLEKAT